MPPATRDIVWIASYPKSGNTWVRFMACNLLFGRQESAATLAQLIPDIHELGAQSLAPPGLVKTHFAYSPDLPDAHRTAACIYVVRHPADVLVANFHYSLRSAAVPDSPRAAFDRYVDDFLAHRGEPRWIQLAMGSWDDNVRSWLAVRHPFPVYVLKYEDLQTNPRYACELLSKLLKPDSSAQQIDAAVANASFERMREIEERDIRERRVGIFYKPYLQGSISSGRRFMRRGVAGEGARTLTGSQRERLLQVFGPLLNELNYQDQ